MESLAQHLALVAIAKPRLARPIGEQRHDNRAEQRREVLLEQQPPRRDRRPRIRLIEIHLVGMVQDDDFVLRISGLASRDHPVIVPSNIDRVPGQSRWMAETVRMVG
jgi:hypothetical protein